MIKENEIVIPKELTDNMQVLTTIVSPIKPEIGILIMGENMDAGNYKDELSVLRVYLLDKRGAKYHIENELEAFAFHSFESAYSFLVGLPEMSALELLLMMNSTDVDIEKIGGGNYILQ